MTDLGKVAFEAHWNSDEMDCEWTWEQLDGDSHKAWRAAAQAVADEVRADSTKLLELYKAMEKRIAPFALPENPYECGLRTVYAKIVADLKRAEGEPDKRGPGSCNQCGSVNLYLTNDAGWYCGECGEAQ